MAKPLGKGLGLGPASAMKNSSVELAGANPLIVKVFPFKIASVNTGKLSNLFGPVSPSPLSLGVTSS